MSQAKIAQRFGCTVEQVRALHAKNAAALGAMAAKAEAAGHPIHGFTSHELREREARAFWLSQGFEEISTGGGCVGLYRKLSSDGAHILITSAANEGTLPESVNSGHDVGFYDADSQQTDYRNCRGALAAAEWIASKCAP